ncbi:hypothetical protein M3Y97_00895400 [Aphelenchoides bicaudatus]|nr:hypothetical protein M3Y97_00895400 [Aphelenchoides bicaudatus]
MPEDTHSPILSENSANVVCSLNEDNSSADNLSFVKNIQQSVDRFDENFFELTENVGNSSIGTPIILNPATSSPECLETIEEVIAAAKRVYYRDIAKELETESQHTKKAKKDDHNNQQTTINTASSSTNDIQQVDSPLPISTTQTSSTNQSDQQRKQSDSILSLISPNALNLFQQIYFAQKSSEAPTSPTNLAAKTSEKVSDTQSTSTSTTSTDLDQKQALTMCKLQLNDNQISNPDFLKHSQLTHPEFQSLPDKVPNYKQLISNFNLKISNVIKAQLNSVNKATLMLNAVHLNGDQSIFLFVSVSFYSQSSQSTEFIFLGVRKFITQNDVRLNLKSKVLKILNDFNLKKYQIFCCIYAGLDNSTTHIIFNNTYRSFHDSFKQTVERVFDENSVTISRIRNAFLSAVEQFCEDKEKHREFFELTGVYLHPTQMNFEELDKILRTHRKVFVEIKNRGIVNMQILCSETNKWFDLSLNNFKSTLLGSSLTSSVHFKYFVKIKLMPHVPETCITIDYIHPFLMDFLSGLKTKFNLLNNLRLQLTNAIQSEFKMVFETRKYNGFFAKATALNSQVCHYLDAKHFNNWKDVPRIQITRCFCSGAEKAKTFKDFGSQQIRSTEQFCNTIFKAYLQKIESEFTKTPPKELDFKHSAITFWSTIDKECVKEIAIRMLQIVASPIFPNETLRQVLLDWISNQPTNKSSISLEDLQTIERNCFVYLNRKFLL